MNIAVFASGNGTDFQSIIDWVEKGKIKAKINMLIASKPDIYAIERAKAHNIPYRVFCKKDYSSADEMFEKMIELLREYKTDLIVLAGYLTILSSNIVDAYKDRIINIHPSLLPKYGGKGMYGLKVHQAVIAAGDKVTGCTVHYVDLGADTGKIIAQCKVRVKKDDTPESLQARVLDKEHLLLPREIKKIVEKNLT